MTIDRWLDEAATELADAMVPSARLDAEIILAHTLGHHRSWLHAHGDEEIDPRRVDIANARIELRLERVPVAYIIGHKEFYGRRFFVSPDTLVPRPDSEALVELAIKWRQSNPNAKQLVDVGTGSGCLGITIGLECPGLNVTLCDIDRKALRIAEKNAAAHNLPVRCLESHLLDSYPLRADLVVANLPYVDRSWTVDQDTKHEPAEALFADDGGLSLIYELIETLPSHTSDSAGIIIEADPRQHESIIKKCADHGLAHRQTLGYGILFER